MRAIHSAHATPVEVAPEAASFVVSGSSSADVSTASSSLALIYLRVSTARQASKGGEAEGYSIPAQRTACVARARELGAVVTEEFVDAGASARSADRDGLQALLARLEDSEQPQVNFIIVHKLDRLARDRADDVQIQLAIRKAGAQLVSVSENIDESPSGLLVHGIMASIAEFYSRNLSHEAQKGMTEKVLRGGTPGKAPIGYTNVIYREQGQEIRTVEVDAERAPHVRWAFSAYATGDWSISALRNELEARGLTSKPTKAYVGTPLGNSQVHRMLSHPYYKGIVTHKGAQYPGRHEPLVDEATWQQVQDVLSGRRIAGDRSWKHTHHLKGALSCGRCGGRMGFGHARGRRGDIYDYFFCLGRHTGRTECDLPYVPVIAVEQLMEQPMATCHPGRGRHRRHALAD